MEAGQWPHEQWWVIWVEIIIREEGGADDEVPWQVEENEETRLTKRLAAL